ncbi:MAG TPA: DUF4402 domain-containing protein [Caulobacteraceae bacterium]|nr:DUF4402 domain-containing protein [Caulobacteraceae bacterium]
MNRRNRRYLAALAGALLGLGGTQGMAQTITPEVVASPDLGVIIPAGTTSTTFSFASATGSVTQTGAAVRKSAGSTRAQVRLNCSGSGNTCANRIAVKVGSIGSPSGKAGALGNFNVTALSGTISAASGTNPRSFTIKPINKSTPASFYVGADLPIAASNGAGEAGPATSQLYVYDAPASPSMGATISAAANIYRGVTITGTALNFGTIVKPSSGSATVTLNPDTNTRSVTGSSAVGSASRAAFVVTGENSVAITVTQDSVLTLNRTGGGSILVTLSRSAVPTSIGSGTSGAAGSTTFYTGGTFVVGSATLLGIYTGSYNTRVDYN